ncbi:MAG: 3-oxoacyl-[acyl-carrier-protein] reductase [candidate division Zixibacteria bacterium]|nr:3-oxoacyl-[acyl-carrier-protein] reductase [candidate division Zixibacteria bacterium]MBU1469219.1 3-oxoacyl-[acyl-carrier-protein] reductase [candidate division Zixibacteria bacterium]MBU2624527.1 3-oxoacyl-[acyl-carrier-protein] reductase [candidate division Zixibacteria bacterium]
MMLKDKVCLVTGSARGIGYSIAEEFVRNGAKVVLSDVLEDALSESVKTLSASGGEVIGIAGDVTDSVQVTNLVAQTVEKLGGIDVLVNNAGVTRDTLLVRMTESDWDLVLRVNLKGAFLMTQAAAKIMMKKRSGKIVNISSVVGLMGNAGQANYAASKAGLIGLTKSAAKELAGRGICVNAIAPGYIETDMTAGLSDAAKAAFLENVPLKRAGSPSDIAQSVLFLASSASDYITGQVLGINGGLYM